MVLQACVAFTIGLLTFGYRYLSYAGFPNDHFVHLAAAQQIAGGALPVRDFVERGIPLMSLTSAAAQEVLGAGLHAEVILIAAAFAFAAALVFIVAARVSRSVLIGAAAAAITVAVYPVSYSYPKLLVYAIAFAAALIYCNHPSPVRLTAVALSVVIAFLFRHDHGVFLAAGSVLMLVAYHGFTRDAAIAVGRFAAAGLLLVSPYVFWVQAYHGIGAYVADGVEFSRREAERSSRFELPSFGTDPTQPLFRTVVGGPVINVRWADGLSDVAIRGRERAHELARLDSVGAMTWQYELRRWSSSDLEALVRDPAIADTHGFDRARFRLTDADPGLVHRLMLGKPMPAEGFRLRENALAALFYASWALPVAALIVLALAWSQVTLAVRAAVIMTAAVQLGMNATMLRDPIDLRIRDVVVPMAIAAAFVAGRAWVVDSGRVLRWSGRAAAVALLGMTTIAAGAVGRMPEHLEQAGALDGASGVRQRWAELGETLRRPAHQTGVPDASRALVDYVLECTPPDARLFAMTFAPELFFYTGRMFAGGHMTLTPGYYVTERHATMMLDRLARENVPLVVLDNETEHEIRQLYPRVMRYVDGRYRRVGDLPAGGDKRFIVLAERRHAPVRVYGSGELACFAGAPAGTAI